MGLSQAPEAEKSRSGPLKCALFAEVPLWPDLTGIDRPGYCEDMKNITVTVDDEVYRRARVKAAEHDTSVSALVKRYLMQLTEDESGHDRLAREERELRERIGNFRASDRLPRDHLHRRR